MKPHLEVGYIARAHGIAGEVVVRTFDPASEVLFDVNRILLRARDGGERERAVRAVRSSSKDLLVSLDRVEDRTAAEGLVGATVLVFREDLPAPEAGEYFQADLVGLAAVDEQGRPLGRVAEVWSTGPVPNLLIRSEGAPEWMVPFADEFVPEVRLAEGVVVIRPPQWTEE